MRPHPLLPLLLALFLPACRSATIECESQEEYDFSALRTYQWISPEAAGLDPLGADERQWAKGVSRVLAEEFGKRGYVREEIEPDFLVLVVATTRRGRRVGGAPNRGRGARSRVEGSSFRYEEGMIAVRAWERERGLLLWDCFARDAIRESEPPTEEGIVALVREMMSRWPAEVPPAAREPR